MTDRVTPEKIEKLEKYQIFVFGSNLLGIHGAGAAKFAYETGLAEHGKGYGIHWASSAMVGSYAIPTKGLVIETLPLSWIKYYVDNSLKEIKKWPSLEFLITEVGCGLAGYAPEDIAPLFKEAMHMENVYLPQRFWNVLNKQ